MKRFKDWESIDISVFFNQTMEIWTMKLASSMFHILGFPKKQFIGCMIMFPFFS